MPSKSPIGKKYTGLSPLTQLENPLKDNYGRSITYLRLSVTDRCNLRCTYCMPLEGITKQPRSDLLSWEEISRLVNIFVDLGIHKLRLTGGEPFMRKGLMDFVSSVSNNTGLSGLYLTTNGVDVADKVPELKKFGISGINLSLDTLNRERFLTITRRDSLNKVIDTFNTILHHKIPLKINTVILENFNTDEILPIARLAFTHPVDVRFIEKMPFGRITDDHPLIWDATKITSVLKTFFPNMQPLPSHHSTATLYHIPEFQGRIGVIAGNSRTFCSSCSRVRVTAQGKLKMCLYDRGVLDLKYLLRQGADNKHIQAEIQKCILKRFKDGFEACSNSQLEKPESMAKIGG